MWAISVTLSRTSCRCAASPAISLFASSRSRSTFSLSIEKVTERFRRSLSNLPFTRKSCAPSLSTLTAISSSSRPVITTTGTFGECECTRLNVSYPSQSGSERSRRTMSISSRESLSRPSSRSIAVTTSKWRSVSRLRYSRTITLSGGLSSIISTLICSSFIAIGLLRTTECLRGPVVVTHAVIPPGG